MLLRIRPTLESASRIPHFLDKRLGGGQYTVKHPENCECFILHSLVHAPHVSYNMGTGTLFCDHCKTTELVPCPGKRVSLLSRQVLMDPMAIADDLKRFQVAHEDCPKPEAGHAESSN